MDRPVRILVVEDNPADFGLMQRQVARRGLPAEWRRVACLDDLRDALAESDWDIVLSDFSVPSLDFPDVLESVRGRNADLPLVLVSGSLGEERAVELLKQGVWDFVLKDRLVRLVPAVEHSLREASARRARHDAEAALRQSEARFRILVEHLPAVTYMAPADRERAYAYVSPQVETILGFPPDEFTSAPGLWARLLHPDDRERVLAESRDCQQTGRPFACEYRLLARNGQTVWVRDKADPVDDSTANGTLYRGLMIDVSDRKRTELERETTVSFLRLVNGSVGVADLIAKATAFLRQASACECVSVHLMSEGGGSACRGRDALEGSGSAGGGDPVAAPGCGMDGRPLPGRVCDAVVRGLSDLVGPFLAGSGGFWTNSASELLASRDDGARDLACDACGGGHESVAVLRLCAGEEPLGLLWLSDVRRDRFSAEAVSLLERLAGHFAAALAKLLAEEALRESEERHRLLFQTSRDAMVICAPPGWRFLHGNPAAIRMFRAASEEELTSRAPWDYSPERQPDGAPSAEKAREMIAAALRDGSHAFEWRHRHQNGEEFPAMVLLTRFELKGVSMVQATVRDITAQKEAEAALLASEERYRALFEGAAEGILVPDLETLRLHYANPAVCRMLGYTLDELLGMTVDEIHPPGQRGFVHGDLAAREAGVLGAEDSVPCLRKDGTVLYASITTSPIEFDGNRCLVAFLEDVTERLRLAAEKERLEAQIRQTQKLEAIGSLAGGVAHDFNNILMGIRGHLEFAMDDMERDGAPAEELRQALALVTRAADLTGQLLAFSRKQTLKPAVVELNQLIREHLKMLERLLGEDVQTRFLPSPELGHVKADPGQISQVLMNLVVNGRDAMPNGGILTIETANVGMPDAGDRSSARPCVRITVRDTGSGMDEATMARIFEPFFTTKEQGRGTGMGLAMVHGIVKQHGGDIRVRSQPGRGTIFEVYLPRTSGNSLAVPATQSRKPRGGGETILLAEDEPSVRGVVRKWLGRWGYQVIDAPSADEAEKAAAAHAGHIDLLLTDVVMPGRSGLELYESLASSRPDLKVLYMSGYTSDAIVDRGILKEGVHFMEKPIESDVLASKLRELLGPPRGLE